MLATFAALAMALAFGVPLASAHGAPAPRELDTRVLADDDGALGYGGCTEAGCNPATPPQGLDLLALDVREAWLGDAPALVARIVFQTEQPQQAGRGLVLSLVASGQTSTVTLASPDGATYASTQAARIDGPHDVGDGHPKALDAWIPLSALGVAPGAELTGIQVVSTQDGEPDDVMPGGWYSNGQEVPHLPHDADPGEALAGQPTGTYTVKGPAPLADLAPPTGLLDLAQGANHTLTLRNALAGLPQFAWLRLEPEPGVQASLVGAGDNGTLGIALDPAATRQATLAVGAGSASGLVRIVATTDLGGRAEATVDVVAPPPAVPANATSSAPAKDASAATALPALAVAAAAAVAWRRRHV